MLFLTQVQILWKEAALAWHECSANKNRNFYLWVSCWLLFIFILWKLQISNSKKNVSTYLSPPRLLETFWVYLQSTVFLIPFFISFILSFFFLYLFLSEVMFTNLFLFCFHEVACKKCKILFALWHSTDIRFVFYSNHFIFSISICLYLNHFIVIISKVLL